jgi:hypothetical protein
VSVAARILHGAQLLELAHHMGGAQADRAFARDRRATQFDWDIVGAFLGLTEPAAPRPLPARSCLAGWRRPPATSVGGVSRWHAEVGRPRADGVA